MLRHFRPTDLGAVAQLAMHATLGIVNLTEGVHQSVLRTVGGKHGALPGRTAGITGLVYRGVRGVTGLVGTALDKALTGLTPLLSPNGANATPDSTERTLALAALNGVLGDRLAASDNPLALHMTLRLNDQDWQPGTPADLPAPPPAHVLLTIHGLCMTDTQWLANGVDHGAHLAKKLGAARLSLRYNTGLHVSDNGEQLARLLERLVTTWPVPLTRLTIVAHSMGGLLARSAHAAGVAAGHAWPAHLTDLVCLGTPHHGSPLERAGAWVDTLLNVTPYSAPFAKLGQLRSAGITDLRHGYVLPRDWQASTHPRKWQQAVHRHTDSRTPLPLPKGVACYTVAATLASQRGLLAERLTGDGLVPLNSALGKHDNPTHRLAFPPDHQCVLYRTGHLELLSSPKVTAQLERWLVPDQNCSVAPR
ncbi:MAG: GPI inositol-deacylase [Burkholderiales bacterium]|nr:GPI inositol-deacylase [Burkholderiales bacterium]